MDRNEFVFEVYVHSKLLGTAKTDERFDLLRKHFTDEELKSLAPQSIEFKLISTGE